MQEIAITDLERDCSYMGGEWACPIVIPTWTRPETCTLAAAAGDYDAMLRLCVGAKVLPDTPLLRRAGGDDWLVFAPTKDEILLSCDNLPQPLHLVGLGTLHVPPGCVATSSSWRITGKVVPDHIWDMATDPGAPPLLDGNDTDAGEVANALGALTAPVSIHSAREEVDAWIATDWTGASSYGALTITGILALAFIGFILFLWLKFK